MFHDNKIIRFINRNRRMIIWAIAAIIFVLLLIKVLNNISIKGTQKSTESNNNLTRQERKSKDSIITDTKISNDKVKENYKLITDFVNFCNTDVQQAYDLLTEECKENLYPSIEEFNKNYINVVFKEKKEADIQSWIKNNEKYTYLVKFYGELITTGNTKDKEYEDYITIDEEKQKININRYIGRFEKKIQEEINNIKFEINSVDIYKDYEIYNLKISNFNNKQVILDNLESTASTYIETNKDTKINCSNYEAGINSFRFNAGVIKNIKLKFIRQYNTNIKDEKLTFSSVILDNENNEETSKITIEF